MAVEEWQVGLFLTTLVIGLLIHKWLENSKKSPAPLTSSRPSSESTLTLIKDRRTVPVSKMTGAKLTKKELEMILEASNWAPTHGKTEPWRFVIISGHISIEAYLNFLEDFYQKHRDTLSEESQSTFHAKLASVRKEWPFNISHLAIIIMKRKALKDKLMPEWEELCATAMAVQNAHLMASSLHNVAFFWSSHTWCQDARDSSEMKVYLNMEEEDKVLGALCLGKHQPGFVMTSSRGSIEEKVAYRMD